MKPFMKNHAAILEKTPALITEIEDRISPTGKIRPEMAPIRPEGLSIAKTRRPCAVSLPTTRAVRYPPCTLERALSWSHLRLPVAGVVWAVGCELHASIRPLQFDQLSQVKQVMCYPRCQEIARAQTL